MSLERARIIKGGGAQGAAPSTDGFAKRVPREVIAAREEAARILADAEKQATLAVAEATKAAREAEIAKLAAQALAMRQADEKRAERDAARTIEVATLLAERLIGEALAIAPARIAELATAALEQTRGAKKVRIDAHAADVDALTKVLGDLGQIAEVRVDDQLERGSLVVHTELGKVDGRLRPQLERLAEVLEAMSNADATSPKAEPAELPKPAWRLNLILFLATLGAVFFTALDQYAEKGEAVGLSMSHATYVKAFQFLGSMMTILVAHELGHYVAARIHKVDASLPFFIPMPLLSPFGTMGAVIRMRGTINTRRALLDIGASGPLAGMLFAIPLYIWGVHHSEVVAFTGPGDGMVELGEPIIVKVLDRLFAPALGDGMTLNYSPVAFGAWGGMFVTMINLLPVGQLDGGHVAYALFGPKQDRYAMTAHRAMLVFFCVIMLGHLLRDTTSGRGVTAALMGRHIASGLFWLVWFQVLAVLGTLSKPQSKPDEDDAGPQLGWRMRGVVILSLAALASIAHLKPSAIICISFFVGLVLLIVMERKGGVLKKHELLVHPPTGDEPLALGRKAVAIFTLVLFALLFMPEPFSF